MGFLRIQRVYLIGMGWEDMVAFEKYDSNRSGHAHPHDSEPKKLRLVPVLDLWLEIPSKKILPEPSEPLGKFKTKACPPSL